jgi:hypothetical protein
MKVISRGFTYELDRSQGVTSLRPSVSDSNSSYTLLYRGFTYEMNSLERCQRPLEADLTSYSVIYRGNRYLVNPTAEGDRYLCNLLAPTPLPKSGLVSIPAIENDYAFSVEKIANVLGSSIG